MSKKRAVIIDTDPGIDDAVALAIALNHEELDVKLLTTVAGNVSVAKTTDNTLKLLSFFEKEIPVAEGSAHPLINEFEDSADIHGESGMDGYDFPKPTRQIETVHAVEAMRRTILESKEPITLVPIAALTNIALLFAMYPEVKANIEEIVLMGGTMSRGNTNTSAEFNIYVDPHAAKMVFQSGVPIVMVGTDVTSVAALTNQETEKIKTLGKVGEMFYAMFKHYRGGSLKTGLKMHDVCAIAYLVAPQLFETQATYVEIATEGPAAGATVADLKMKYHDEKNATVCVEVDVDGFRNWVINELSKI
uniref:ribonucleoside hydrolase RihC n=1 Tax=Candidatus Enterococcus willemsii TaxID=1857215 RepID=UPI00403F25B6